MSERITERIAALLAKAEGTDNEHEASAYMSKVQELLTSHQIELETVRQAALNLNRPAAVPTTRRILIGAPGTRGLKTYVQLFLVVARNNNLKVDIAHNSSAVIPYGFEADIDLTEALYNSLVVQMVAASEAYLNTGAYRLETVPTADGWGSKPVNKTTARIAFQDAFARQVGVRLRAARLTAVTAATAPFQTHNGTTGGAELVLVRREMAVADHYARNSTAGRRHWGGSRPTHVSGANDAGRQAGARARLGSEKAIGGHRAQLN